MSPFLWHICCIPLELFHLMGSWQNMDYLFSNLCLHLRCGYWGVWTKRFRVRLVVWFIYFEMSFWNSNLIFEMVILKWWQYNGSALSRKVWIFIWNRDQNRSKANTHFEMAKRKKMEWSKWYKMLEQKVKLTWLTLSILIRQVSNFYEDQLHWTCLLSARGPEVDRGAALPELLCWIWIIVSRELLYFERFFPWRTYEQLGDHSDKMIHLHLPYYAWNGIAYILLSNYLLAESCYS